MARKRGKKALYEVMSKARKKPGFGRTLEKMLPEKPVPKKEEVVEVAVKKKSEADAETSKKAAKWWKKPRIVQFNVGRIEFSIPYQIVVALILGSILVILAAFQLGKKLTEKNSSNPEAKAAQTSIEETKEQQKEPEVALRPAPVEEESVLLKIEEQRETPKEEPKTAEPVAPSLTGNNVIVLVQFGSQEDLRPVRAHFAEYGIETEIVLEKGSYFLQTKNRYNNPATPGTDGYKALQEIIKVGAKYKGKAPPNYETFAPNFFSDAYGKRIK